MRFVFKTYKNSWGLGDLGETQKTINFCGKLSFILSLLSPYRLHCYQGIYIFTTPTYKLLLNLVHFIHPEFQHFIPRFSRISLFYRYHWMRGLGVRPKDRVTLSITLEYTSKNIYMRLCKCIWKIFRFALCIYIYIHTHPIII